jgi:hypothetical protein
LWGSDLFVVLMALEDDVGDGVCTVDLVTSRDNKGRGFLLLEALDSTVLD